MRGLGSPVAPHARLSGKKAQSWRHGFPVKMAPIPVARLSSKISRNFAHGLAVKMHGFHGKNARLFSKNARLSSKEGQTVNGLTRSLKIDLDVIRYK